MVVRRAGGRACTSFISRVTSLCLRWPGQTITTPLGLHAPSGLVLPRAPRQPVPPPLRPSLHSGPGLGLSSHCPRHRGLAKVTFGSSDKGETRMLLSRRAGSGSSRPQAGQGWALLLRLCRPGAAPGLRGAKGAGLRDPGQLLRSVCAVAGQEERWWAQSTAEYWYRPATPGAGGSARQRRRLLPFVVCYLAARRRKTGVRAWIAPANQWNELRRIRAHCCTMYGKAAQSQPCADGGELFQAPD